MSDDQTPSRRNPLYATLLHHSVTLIMLTGFIAFGVWGYLTFKKKNIMWTPGNIESPARRYFIDSHIDRMRLAAGAHEASFRPTLLARSAH